LDEYLERETVDEVEEEHIEQSSEEPPEPASDSHGCEYCSLKGRGDILYMQAQYSCMLGMGSLRL
jgi:hypothetical protein